MAASFKRHTSLLLLLNHDDGNILTYFLCAIHPEARSFRAVGATTPRRPVSKVGQLEFFSRSEEHTSELQSLMRISYAVFCLKKKKRHTNMNSIITST